MELGSEEAPEVSFNQYPIPDRICGLIQRDFREYKAEGKS